MLMQMALNDWSNLENTDLEIRWKGTGKMIQDIEHWDLPWPYISQSERLASLLTLQLVASSISRAVFSGLLEMLPPRVESPKNSQ